MDTTSPTTFATQYNCRLCSKTYRHQTSLYKHHASAHRSSRDVHKCKICAHEFKFASGLSRHCKEAHSFHQEPNPSATRPLYQCKLCDKEYRHRCSLSKHKKAVHSTTSDDPSSPTTTSLTTTTHSSSTDLTVDTSSSTDNSVILALINAIQEQSKSQTEQNRQLMELLRQNAASTNNNVSAQTANVTNNHNNNNSNNTNNQFNLQFFLNETCKNAMDIDQFVDSIKVELSDLENIGRHGYVEGISSIIISKLKSLDITERPIHCTDKKREVIYVKKPELWEKEGDKNLNVKNVIKKVRTKNREMLPVFKQLHPDCIRSSSRFADQYNEMIMEVTNPETDNHDNKIIRRICENVTIDKENF